MEVVVTNGAINHAKLQSNHHHQLTNIRFLQAGCPSCRPTNNVKALTGIISHSMDLLTPVSPGGLPTLSLTTNSSWLPWVSNRTFFLNHGLCPRLGLYQSPGLHWWCSWQLSFTPGISTIFADNWSCCAFFKLWTSTCIWGSAFVGTWLWSKDLQYTVMFIKLHCWQHRSCFSNEIIHWYQLTGVCSTV